MKLLQSKNSWRYAATALNRILVATIVTQLVAGAPTGVSFSDLASYEPCGQIECPNGHGLPNPKSGICICSGSTNLRIFNYLTQLAQFPKHLHRDRLQARQPNISANSNATNVPSTSSPSLISFIPPPAIDITPALIQQSLSEQPQTLGEVSAVQPYFHEGVIRITMNLVGSAASNGLLLNASTKIPALTIGDNNEPSLIIVPQTVTNGTEIIETEFATIIAINMYSKDYLTYWVLLHNGTLVSLLSDCKIHDIDRIDPQTSAVSIMPSAYTNQKRGRGSAFAIASQHDADKIARRAQRDTEVSKRGLADVNVYNTKMTPAACQNMECTIDGDAPLWNTFTRNCYCDVTPPYWTVNPSGDTGP